MIYLLAVVVLIIIGYIFWTNKPDGKRIENLIKADRDLQQSANQIKEDIEKLKKPIDVPQQTPKEIEDFWNKK
jgi:septation ring formation regulator EzrA